MKPACAFLSMTVSLASCSTCTPHAPVCHSATRQLPKPSVRPPTLVPQAAEVWQQSERWMERGGAPPVETWCLFGTGEAAGGRKGVEACKRGFPEAWQEHTCKPDACLGQARMLQQGNGWQQAGVGLPRLGGVAGG